MNKIKINITSLVEAVECFGNTAMSARILFTSHVLIEEGIIELIKHIALCETEEEVSVIVNAVEAKCIGVISLKGNDVLFELINRKSIPKDIELASFFEYNRLSFDFINEQKTKLPNCAEIVSQSKSKDTSVLKIPCHTNGNPLFINLNFIKAHE